MLAHRKNRRPFRLGWVVLLAVSLARAAQATPLKDFERLDQEMFDAAERYIDGLTAARHSDATAKPEGPESKPVDGRLAVLKKMDALTQGAAGSSDAAYIAVQTFLWAMTIDTGDGFRRFKQLVERFPNDARLDNALAVVEDIHSASGTAAQWVSVLQELVDSTNRQEAKMAALMSLGRIHLADRDLVHARSAFKTVAETSKDDGVVEAARGYVFEIDHLQIGMAAPDFSAKRLDGGTVTLQSLRGKVVLLDFWASWCPTCLGEVPHLRAAASRFSEQPFEIVAVSLDDTRTGVANITKAFKMPGIHVWDERGGDNPVARRYNVHTLPVWYLIDAEGVIRARDPLGEKLIPAIQAALSRSRSTGH